MCSHSDATTRNDFGAAKMAVNRLSAAVARASRGIGLPFMSVVIDTYDSRRFVKDFIGTRLKQQILDIGGRLICRPDSGNPNIEPGLVGKDLEASFGVTINSKGYKVLHPSVGVIQGDGIRIDTFEDVVRGWIDAGFSLDNFALGMGSGVTHDGARDDFSFSVKAIALFTTSAGWTRLLKEPITDIGKKSLTGLVTCTEVLINTIDLTKGDLVIFDALEIDPEWAFRPSQGWYTWFKNGYQVHEESFDEVIARARS